ncbi:MAG: diacylglycerol kinase family protein [Elainellaceae cyanobacterium]
MSQQLSTDSRDALDPSLEKQTDGLEQTADERDMSWQVASNLFVSFRYAWAGISYAFRTQRNFRIHSLIGVVAIALGLWVQLSRGEIAVIELTIGIVMAMELLNTAIEAVVDLTVKNTYHELAKVAKDCAAGAVLISALAALLVAGSLLLLPVVDKASDLLPVILGNYPDL